MRLDEKYRPKTYDEIIGQDKAVHAIGRFSANGIGGRAIWIAGASGTGKTTLARIIARQIAAPIMTIETVGRQLSPNRLKEITDRWTGRAMFGSGGHALIVNEAHGLTKPTVELLLDVVENLRDYVVVIFTTTREGNDLFEEQLDSSPFASRCLNINLAARNLCEPFAARLKEIAAIEELDGKPLDAYRNLLKKNRNNFRACLMEIEAGRMMED